MGDLIRWDRTICPPGWTGWVREVKDESVFVCGACPDPQACADADRCARDDPPDKERQS